MTYAVRGANDEVTTCSCCGRANLKKTVILETLDGDGNGTGLIERFGTDCATRATGWKPANLNRKVEEAQYAERQSAYRIASDVARMRYSKAVSAVHWPGHDALMEILRG